MSKEVAERENSFEEAVKRELESAGIINQKTVLIFKGMWRDRTHRYEVMETRLDHYKEFEKVISRYGKYTVLQKIGRRKRIYLLKIA
ncbi:MAG: hypothetical protein ACP5NC_06305 [Nitrososphaeria archaeon]